MPDRHIGLERHRIHRALSRPNLLLGGDRELVLVTGLSAAILVFVVLTPYSAILGCVTWVIILAVLRLMAKSAPLMRRVYLRHMHYRSSYRPTSAPWRQF